PERPRRPPPEGPSRSCPPKSDEGERFLPAAVPDGPNPTPRMSEPEQPSQTKGPDQAKIQDTSLSDLLRVGSDPNAMLLGLTPPDSEGGSEESGKDETQADAAGTPEESGGAARE